MFAAQAGYSQCDTLNLGSDTLLCEGTLLELDAGAGFVSYHWNNGSTDQYLSVSEPGVYWCDVVYIDSTNLVINGDFSQGNTGFSTNYVLGGGGPWGILSEEGTYVIGTNAALTHVNFSPCVDHTSGDGLYMIINGDTVQEEFVWCQTVDVDPNTNYFFSGWFTSVQPDNPAILSYFINGSIIETVHLTSITCLWQNFIKDWNSGTSTTAEICILNQNTELSGNDFGIDDIHLLKYCPSSDTIVIEYMPAPEVDLGNDTLLCAGTLMPLSAGEGFASYLWNNGSPNSVVMVNQAGMYWVQVTSESGCIGADTIFVEYTEEIDLNLGNDTTICEQASLLLSAGEGFAGYNWFDGSSASTYLVTQPGTYWVNVLNSFGCTATDSINIAFSAAANVSLGGDTTICSNENYTLSPGSGFAGYLWQDGSTNPFHQVSGSGYYWVIVTDDNGCLGSDTVSIVIIPSPVVSLGNDTTLCTGSSLLLDPGSQYSSYLWQDNSTLPFFTVTSPGYYSVTVTEYNCPASDDIYVNITSPVIDLGNDTLLCSGDTLYLNPGQGYSSYLWQDNSTEPVYEVVEGGNYLVVVTDSYNCSSEDTVEITSLFKPAADLGGDKGFCEGGSILLETAQGPYSYTWNGEPGDYYLEVGQEGTYTVEVSNECGSVSDQVVVTEFPVPLVNLGSDQVIQPGESIQLDAGGGFDQYIWQDGSGGQYFMVIAEQIDTEDPYYWVEVWEGFCKSSDTARIEMFNVKVPIVITPDGDGYNDIFSPYKESWSGINRNHIIIFNRWGEKVWESDNFEQGWDGKRDGYYVADGTYFWILDVYYGENDLSQTIKGSVTVLNAGN